MLGMQRFWAEVAAVGVMLIALAGWWHEHNVKERTQGAATCIASTTETQATGTAKTLQIDTANTDTLQRVSDAYVNQIAALNADRDGLAQRLRDTAAAHGGGAVSQVPGSACSVSSAAADARLAECTRQRAADTAAGAKAIAEVNAMRTAWADMAAKAAKAGQ